jgi:hypothetical protein
MDTGVLIPGFQACSFLGLNVWNKVGYRQGLIGFARVSWMIPGQTSCCSTAASRLVLRKFWIVGIPARSWPQLLRFFHRAWAASARIYTLIWRKISANLHIIFIAGPLSSNTL